MRCRSGSVANASRSSGGAPGAAHRRLSDCLAEDDIPTSGAHGRSAGWLPVPSTERCWCAPVPNAGGSCGCPPCRLAITSRRMLSALCVPAGQRLDQGRTGACGAVPATCAGGRPNGVVDLPEVGALTWPVAVALFDVLLGACGSTPNRSHVIGSSRGSPAIWAPSIRRDCGCLSGSGDPRLDVRGLADASASCSRDLARGAATPSVAAMAQPGRRDLCRGRNTVARRMARPMPRTRARVVASLDRHLAGDWRRSARASGARAVAASARSTVGNRRCAGRLAGRGGRRRRRRFAANSVSLDQAWCERWSGCRARTPEVADSRSRR